MEILIATKKYLHAQIWESYIQIHSKYLIFVVTFYYYAYTGASQ